MNNVPCEEYFPGFQNRDLIGDPMNPRSIERSDR